MTLQVVPLINGGRHDALVEVRNDLAEQVTRDQLRASAPIAGPQGAADGQAIRGAYVNASQSRMPFEQLGKFLEGFALVVMRLHDLHHLPSLAERRKRLAEALRVLAVSFGP